MKEMQSTKGFVILVDDKDYIWLSQWKWCANTAKWPYPIRFERNGRGRIFMHKEIMQPPDDIEVDHIDGNVNNNQRHNLRLCTHSQNMQNIHKNTAEHSGYKGVCWSKRDKVYRSYIRTTDGWKHLGNFKDELDAAMCYNVAALQYFGEFASINVFGDYNA
jgi:hypothetical protein